MPPQLVQPAVILAGNILAVMNVTVSNIPQVPESNIPWMDASLTEEWHSKENGRASADGDGHNETVIEVDVDEIVGEVGLVDERGDFDWQHCCLAASTLGQFVADRSAVAAVDVAVEVVFVVALAVAPSVGMPPIWMWLISVPVAV